MTTFDRHLLARFLFIFVVMFITTYGLYVVIDGFTNVDGFMHEAESTMDGFSRMGKYYLLQSSQFFDTVGSILAVMSSVCVFALLMRRTELQPILAAGVPTYRLVVPILWGMTFVAGIIVMNREFVIPRYAHYLQSGRGNSSNSGQSVQPVYDYSTRIHMGGKSVFLEQGEIVGAEFTLPVPEIVHELTRIDAPRAKFYEKTGNLPGGWLLTDTRPSFEDINLTENGRQIVFPGAREGQIFVVSDVSFDQLCDRSRSYHFLSTPELLRRIKNPSVGQISVRGQMMFLHTRLTDLLIMYVSVFIAVPMIVRKESRSLIGNMSVCMGILIGLMGVTEAFRFLGSSSLLPMDLAAWSPIIFQGTLSAWLSGRTQS